jgi:hypothetical protein
MQFRDAERDMGRTEISRTQKGVLLVEDDQVWA